MHHLRALLIPSALLLAGGSCSFLAPGDEQFLGRGSPVAVAGAGQAGEPDAEPGSAGDASISVRGGAGGREAASGEAGNNSVAGELGTGGAGTAADPVALISQEKLLLWLKADQGAMEETPGSGVAVWADQSLNEADAHQSLLGSRPKIVTSGATPAMLEFDGIDDQLALPPGFSDFSAGLSVFIITRAADDRACSSLLQLSNEPESQDIDVSRHGGSIHYEVQDQWTDSPSDMFPLDQTVLVGVVHRPGQAAELRVNGMFMSSVDFLLPLVMPRENNFIGRSLYADCQLFHGQIGEIIVYGRSLDTSERDQVQNYLQNRWRYEPPIKSKPGPGSSEE
jgi:hypothetical protein